MAVWSSLGQGWISFFWPVSLTVFAGGFPAFLQSFSQYLKASLRAKETEDWRRERRNDKKRKNPLNSCKLVIPPLK